MEFLGVTVPFAAERGGDALKQADAWDGTSTTAVSRAVTLLSGLLLAWVGCFNPRYGGEQHFPCNR